MIREVIGKVTAALESSNIPYVIVGSYAASAFGIPRADIDVDFIVDADPANLDKLKDELGSEFWFSEVDAGFSLIAGGVFHAVVYDLALKVDFHPLAQDEFSVTSFGRRRRIETKSGYVWVSSPEDTILAKLRICTNNYEYKHYEDVMGMLRTNPTSLDWNYISHWAVALGLEEELNRANREA